MEQIPNRKVKILAMSDTHNKHDKIDIKNLPAADIFIHAGDFTLHSKKDQLERFRNFLKLLPYKYKIVIAGNHDIALIKSQYESHLKNNKQKGYKPMIPQEQIKKIKQCCIYLQNQLIQVQGVKIFGAPYSRDYFRKFENPKQQDKKLWTQIPQNIDVLLTHYPPYNIMDYNSKQEHEGCKGILKVIYKRKPKIHIFGHVHECYGQSQNEQTRFYNVSYLNADYQPENQPMLIQVQVQK